MTYLKKEDIVDISNLIKKDVTFYAHIKNDKKELLKNHIDLCNKYFFRIYKAKDLDYIFKNFEMLYLNILDEDQLNLFKRLVVNIINFHDIGKINPLFQSKKMDNKILDKRIEYDISSKHSILSAVMYIDFFIEEVDKIKTINKRAYEILSEILFLNAYIISRHHSKLNNFEEFLASFQKELYEDGSKAISFINRNYKYIYEKEVNISEKKLFIKGKNIKKYFDKNNKEESIYVYTYTKLMYSLLVASDFYATSEFMNGIELDEFGEINNISDFYDIYKGTEIYKKIRKYENNEYKKEKNLSNVQNINILRNEMFLDAEKELIKNIDSNLFFLEAPTGSGKSNVSINLSFKLLEENKKIKKIYYIYPFNTLIEQNIKTLENIFKTDCEVSKKSNSIFDNIATINSITPIKVDNDKLKNEENTEESNYKYYEKALLNRQFLNYPIILSTHVSLFETMFKTSKESSFAFHQLANSIIVLDEIQSYKNTIWTEIIMFLKEFAKILNIKIIVMSATLPDLNYLTKSDEDSIKLIKDRDKYFSNKLFKNRVVVNYDLIDKEIDDIFEHIKESSKNNKKILIEFIKKKSAYEFFYKLKDDDSIKSNIELLTGDDNMIERKRILRNIENSNNIILVATQVIEAGVDIDMDIGYKDISKLDSEEQFMGRINRSCKKEGVVYFFNLDDTNKIYKNDIRTNKSFTLINKDMKDILINKMFKDYYKLILDILINNYNDSLCEYNIDNFFKECVSKLKFKEIESRMKLIEDDMWNMSVYLSRTITLDDGTILNGDEIWNNYRELLYDNKISYAKKEIELSRLRTLLNYFIYQVKKCDLVYNDRIGDIYFIEDGEKYFKDNKVNKELLVTGIGDFI